MLFRSQDFFPLTVDYQEKFYAGGRIPGGFFKREGRLADREVLVSEDILRKEMANIFSRCWIYVGHASELKKAGDFVSRKVAGRPVVFLFHANDVSPQVWQAVRQSLRAQGADPFVVGDEDDGADRAGEILDRVIEDTLHTAGDPGIGKGDI